MRPDPASSVAIIPARGGSQRIARKNIKLFNGAPMIAGSIRTALVSGLFDRVIVSTDDAQIADIARTYGAEVPFIRPAALSDAFTGTGAVIEHALRTLGQSYEFACCIYATAPFLQTRFLREGLLKLRSHSQASYVFSVCDFAFPVQRALTLNAQGALTPLYPEFRQTRSQDLPPAYQDAGQFYWGRSDAWLRGDAVFSELSLPQILPRYLVEDIDTAEDWTRAEYLYAALKANGELQP
jgi:pseudaminic acid cytidylyltransferase